MVTSKDAGGFWIRPAWQGENSEVSPNGLVAVAYEVHTPVTEIRRIIIAPPDPEKLRNTPGLAAYPPKDEPKRGQAIAKVHEGVAYLDDGVMINSAALWPLLEPQWKDPKKWWTELATAKDKKDYDWSHLAMNYWPERVREKCKTDKSLAIAHGLEHLYVEPEAAPKKTRGRKKGE